MDTKRPQLRFYRREYPKKKSIRKKTSTSYLTRDDSKKIAEQGNLSFQIHYQKYNNIPELFTFAAKVEDIRLVQVSPYILHLAGNVNNSGMLSYFDNESEMIIIAIPNPDCIYTEDELIVQTISSSQTISSTV